jgi:hemerythrin superfamily protein
MMTTAKPTHTRNPVASTKSTPRASHKADPLPEALALLAEDHKDVARLFKHFESLSKSAADADERRDVAQQIGEALTAHTTVEEELFYPALREALDAEALLHEATVEHASLKSLVAQIEAMDPDDDLYDATVVVLGEYVAHHVREEEGELFPKAQKASLDLDALGATMRVRKDELLVVTEGAAR